MRGRLEDHRLITGTGRFVGDLRFEGMAHAWLVRSPHAHARIERVDTRAAAAMPGVIAVFTATDLAEAGIPDLPGGAGVTRPDGSPSPKTDRPLLARERVRYVGEPVAMIVAESEHAARMALESVEVDYTPLAAVSTSSEALGAAAPIWHEAPDNIAFVWRAGEASATRAALERAAHRIRARMVITRVTAATIEPRGALARLGADGRLELYTSGQNPYQLRNRLAQEIFHLDPSRLRVMALDVGGSFGMKSGLYPEDALVLWAASRAGRPVRWIAERSEAFLSDDQARDIIVEGELGLDDEGHFVALDIRYQLNIGAYLSGRSLAPINNIGGVAGVYRTPHISASVTGVFTNTVPTAAYRGAGRPEATYAIERLIDIAADELGLDPFELRWRNLITPDQMPFRTGLVFEYDCGDFPGNMATARALADVDGFAGRAAEARARGRLRGLGIANPIEVAGGPFGRPGKDIARLQVDGNGTIVLDSGTMSVGQGLETAFSRLLAENLGVPIERITYRQGDSDALPFARGSGGSSAISVGGSALWLAAEQLKENGKALAADLLEAAATDIEYRDGGYRVAGTDRFVSLADVARAAEQRGESLMAAGEFAPAAVTFPNGCHICEVEIDLQTGAVEIVRYTVVEDLGRLLHPQLAHGQLMGGIMQGLGQALGEWIVHDGDGQLLTGSFQDYRMPRADDLRDLRIAIREVPTKVNPLGVKGVGEAGTVGAIAATMNAVCNALAREGVKRFDMPASPYRVWAALAAARGRKA